jgi:DNA-binding NarL/FixJ family response regulator
VNRAAADVVPAYTVPMARILIADDHPLYRLALAQSLRDLEAGIDVHEADSLESAHAALVAHPDTDLVLLDLHMPDSHGLMGLAQLRSEHPSIAVAIISAHDEPATIRRAFAFGAAGYLTKRARVEELRAGLRAVLDCEAWVPPALRPAVAAAPASREDASLAARLASLSPQQFRVLSRVADGRLNKQIADELGIQERTVKAHMSAIFEKLGARNRTQAGVMLRALQVADPAD